MTYLITLLKRILTLPLVTLLIFSLCGISQIQAASDLTCRPLFQAKKSKISWLKNIFNRPKSSAISFKPSFSVAAKIQDPEIMDLIAKDHLDFLNSLFGKTEVLKKAVLYNKWTSKNMVSEIAVPLLDYWSFFFTDKKDAELMAHLEHSTMVSYIRWGQKNEEHRPTIEEILNNFSWELSEVIDSHSFFPGINESRSIYKLFQTLESDIPVSFKFFVLKHQFFGQTPDYIDFLLTLENNPENYDLTTWPGLESPQKLEVLINELDRFSTKRFFSGQDHETQEFATRVLMNKIVQEFLQKARPIHSKTQLNRMIQVIMEFGHLDDPFSGTYASELAEIFVVELFKKDKLQLEKDGIKEHEVRRYIQNLAEDHVDISLKQIPDPFNGY